MYLLVSIEESLFYNLRVPLVSENLSMSDFEEMTPFLEIKGETQRDTELLIQSSKRPCKIPLKERDSELELRQVRLYIIFNINPQVRSVWVV